MLIDCLLFCCLQERLDAELKIVGEFGLRNKRELWRVQVGVGLVQQRSSTATQQQQQQQQPKSASQEQHHCDPASCVLRAVSPVACQA